MIQFTRDAISKVPPIFRNVFFLSGLAFAVWMMFFDENNMISQYRLMNELREMESKMEYYHTEAAKAEQEYKMLTTNEEYLTRYAREKYWMKKDNEDLYIVVGK